MIKHVKLNKCFVNLLLTITRYSYCRCSNVSQRNDEHVYNAVINTYVVVLMSIIYTLNNHNNNNHSNDNKQCM